MKIKVLILITLLSLPLLAQQYNIKFTDTINYNVFKVGGIQKTKALKASVKTEYGNFDICLLDLNQNGYFLDTIRPKNSKLYRDALLLAEYQLSRTQFTADGSLLLENNFKHNTLMFINGKAFKLNHLKVDNEQYVAQISFVNNPKLYTRTMGHTLVVDKLNAVKVLNLKTNQQQDIRDFLEKGHYLYVDFIASWCGPCFNGVHNIKNTLLPKNINYLAVAVSSDKEEIKQLFKTHTDDWNQVFIDKGDYKKEIALGMKGFPFGILFDDQGKVVLYGADHNDLKLYFSERK